MIFARAFGGLGNQMFQYAAGKALATRLGTNLAMDFRVIDHRGTRRLTEVFDLDLAMPEALPPVKHESALRYGLWRAFGRNPRFQREDGLGYNPGFETWEIGRAHV